MLDRLAELPRAWLREAELSFSRHDPTRLGLQTRLADRGELKSFLSRMGLDPKPLLASDELVRAKFHLNPGVWAKVGFRSGQVAEASQYFLLDQASRYPIATLRVFARRFGRGASPCLERVLQPALESPDSRWGIALKPGLAAAFCKLPRACLAAVLNRLVSAEKAATLLELTERSGGRPLVFLTVDLADPSSLAIDVEDPTHLEPLGGWLDTLSPRPPRYLKCRPANSEVHWTAYYPWTSLPRQESSTSSLEVVRAYYERAHEDYLACLGPTFQAALVAETAEGSNLELARRAGLSAGMRVLDAGCGVCGPALDIARGLDVTVDGVTLCPAQTTTAREHIAASGLGDRVRVHEGDFHALPMADDSFDAAILLESASYSHAPGALFAELFRVLRPGGILYVKDFVREDAVLSPEEARALDDYDYTYCTRTRTLAEVLAAIGEAGFEPKRSGSLPGASMDHFHQAMVAPQPSSVSTGFFTSQTATPRLSRFGRYHRRSWERLPVEAVEVLGQKPLSQDHSR
ncbi:MAG: hypothetical protein AMXMBFR33_06490 [Candidatus Xenobia bacterium]